MKPIVPRQINPAVVADKIMQAMVEGPEGQRILAEHAALVAEQRKQVGLAYRKREKDFIEKRDALHSKLLAAEERTKAARSALLQTEAEEIKFREAFSTLHDEWTAARDVAERALAENCDPACLELLSSLEGQLADAQNLIRPVPLKDAKLGGPQYTTNHAAVEQYVRKLLALIDEAQRLRRTYVDDLPATIDSINTRAANALRAVTEN